MTVITSKKKIECAELLVLSKPTNILYCESLALLYRDVDNWQQISPLAQKQNKQQKLIADAFYNAAYMNKQKGKYTLAVDLYNVALGFNVVKPEEVYVNLAVIHSENFRMEIKAISLLEKALEIDENYFPALYNLAGLYEEVGDKELAIKYYNRILVIEPLNASALIRLSACFQNKEGTSIIPLLNNALTSSSITIEEKINLNYALGKLLDDNANYSQAFDLYKEANKLDSNNAQSYDTKKQESFTKQNIESFNKEWFSNLPIISSAKPVFICGMFRSGSTLLEQILASHDAITAGGENDFFDSYVNLSMMRFPTDIEHLSVQNFKDIAKNYLKQIKEKFSSTEIVTDKRPDNFLYVGLIKTIFPNAQIIYTKRNLADNCLAIYFQRLDAKLNYATDLMNIKHYYQQQESLMSHWQSIFNDSFHTVEYEDLVSNPKEAVESVFSALNLEWQSQCDEFYLNSNSVKTASLWQVRNPLHQKSCNRWFNYKKQIECILNK